jgi:diguanylate cyclase (GGDEF)-like protein
MPPGRVQLVRLARKVFDAVSAPFKVGEINLVVRPSIGIAMCPTDGETAEALLKNADTAMYRAKRQHSGYAFFDQRACT